MKIELKEPFKSVWNLGYLVTNPEGRRTVILYNSHKDRSSTSYARYLMSCRLGRFLEKDEHVDHVDNDKTNDVIENLQLLTPAKNNAKASKGKTMMTLNCPVCKNYFTRERRQLAHKSNPTCSRKCGGIKSRS